MVSIVDNSLIIQKKGEMREQELHIQESRR
jgi:hypothetical protein